MNQDQNPPQAQEAAPPELTKEEMEAKLQAAAQAFHTAHEEFLKEHSDIALIVGALVMKKPNGDLVFAATRATPKPPDGATMRLAVGQRLQESIVIGEAAKAVLNMQAEVTMGLIDDLTATALETWKKLEQLDKTAAARAENFGAGGGPQRIITP